jgi:hypothetical protein
MRQCAMAPSKTIWSHLRWGSYAGRLGSYAERLGSYAGTHHSLSETASPVKKSLKIKASIA